jgi:hypothetical protein
VIVEPHVVPGNRQVTLAGVASSGTVAAPTLELDFHEAMVELYRCAKREIHYNARYFIDMVSNNGGRETARYLLDTKEPSDGYVVLWERGRLDLSVEAEVLRPCWHGLFSDDQRAIAVRRLRDYGFDVDAYLEQLGQDGS